MMRSFIEQNLTISQKTNLQWSESPKFHMDEMLHTSQAVITTNTVSFNRHGRQILVMQVNSGLLLGSAHPLKEGDEGHESVIILGLTELLHESLGLLLGQLLSKVGQQTEELITDHGVVVILVVQLEDLYKDVESALVLAGLVHAEHVSLGERLLTLLLGASDLLDGLQGGVKVAGTDEVSSIEGVHLTITLEVINIEGKLDSLDLLLLESKFSHVET